MEFQFLIRSLFLTWKSNLSNLNTDYFISSYRSGYLRAHHHRAKSQCPFSTLLGVAVSPPQAVHSASPGNGARHPYASRTMQAWIYKVPPVRLQLLGEAGSARKNFSFRSR